MTDLLAGLEPRIRAHGRNSAVGEGKTSEDLKMIAPRIGGTRLKHKARIPMNEEGIAMNSRNQPLDFISCESEIRELIKRAKAENDPFIRMMHRKMLFCRKSEHQWQETYTALKKGLDPAAAMQKITDNFYAPDVKDSSKGVLPLGTQLHTGVPILYAEDNLPEHLLFQGGTGSGKSNGM